MDAIVLQVMSVVRSGLCFAEVDLVVEAQPRIVDPGLIAFGFIIELSRIQSSLKPQHRTVHGYGVDATVGNRDSFSPDLDLGAHQRGPIRNVSKFHR